MEKTRKSGFATAGLVLGIVGVCTSYIPIINNLSFIMGLLAFIFGIIALCQKANKGKSIAVIILGLLAIIITYYSQKLVVDTLNNAVDDMNNAVNEFNNEIDTMTGGKTDEILKNNLDVVFGEFTATNNGYFTETSLKVNVTNKSAENKSFTIQVEAVDAAGTRIDTDYIYVNSLSAGQNQEFEIFNFVSNDKVEKLKSATFNVVEASMY